MADFPNVIYVLGYDRKIVTNSLTDTASDFDGVHYLEKIVQLPMPLPRLGERDLVVFLENQLNALEYDFSKSVPERERGVLIPSGQLLKTPRTVVRLCNSLRMLTMQLEDEIDAVDLLAMELIRFCAPDLWKMIHDESEVLTGSFSPADFVQGRDYSKYPSQSAMSQQGHEQKPTAEQILHEKLNSFGQSSKLMHLFLFPNAFSGHRPGEDNNPRLLSNPDRLAYYFSQASSSWVFPIAKLQTFVTSEGMKAFFEHATYFDFRYRSQKVLEVMSVIEFHNERQILLEIADGLGQFEEQVFAPNHWGQWEHEFVAVLLLTLLQKDSTLNIADLQELIAKLPLSYVFHLQRYSSIHSFKSSSAPVFVNDLENDSRYKPALNSAFLACMTNADLPEKIIAFGQSVGNNFYYFADLTSLQNARDLSRPRIS